MKKRYSEEQIITAIKEHEAGAKVDDICRRLGISSGTFYNWRSKWQAPSIVDTRGLPHIYPSPSSTHKKVL